MHEYAITVVGADRAGAVADVSTALAGLGLNLTDSTMTLLRGHFAMMLVCTGDVDTARIEAALAPLTGSLGITVRRVTASTAAGGGAPYQLTVHGADRLGIVAAVTGVLAAAGGNITDLTTRLAGSLYVLSAEVDMPPTADIGGVTARLADVAASLGVEAALRPAEADML